MITVTTVCWKRFKHFDEILRAWMDEEEVDQIIVWDNSGSFKTDIPGVLVMSMSHNTNSKWRLMCAQLAKNDQVIIADDDFIPHRGIVKDLLRYYADDKIVGIMGKNFTGPTYYTSSTVHSSQIKKPVKIDYLCSNLMMLHRKYCVRVDIREIPTSLMIDWWLEHELEKEGVTCWVIPTNKWTMIAEGKYEFAQHLDPKMKEIREYYFKKWIKHENPPVPAALRDKTKLT